MKRIVFIAFAMLLLAGLVLSGCTASGSSDYNTQARTYNAPQGQYAGGCGVTAPVESVEEPSAGPQAPIF